MTVKQTLGAVSVFAVCVLLPGSALAQINDARLWSGEVQLGAALSTGNTEIQRFNGMTEVQRNAEIWRNYGRFEGLYARNRGIEAARRYSVTAQNDFKFTERDYLFNNTRYEINRFSGFDYVVTTSVGYGRSVVQSDTQQLDTEVGVGYRQSRFTVSEVVTDEVFLQLGADYRWQIQSGSIITQEVTAELSDDHVVARALSKWTMAVSSRMNLALAYDIRYNSDVAPGRETTDTLTTASLGYRF